MGLARFFTALLAVGSASLSNALATPELTSSITERASSYWYENIAKQGIAPYGPSGYKVFRNVKDFGAKGLCSLSTAS